MGASQSRVEACQSVEGDVTLSVVIPALNEARCIGRTIQSAFDKGCQDGAGGAGAYPEVIVVDGGSTDETSRIAESMGAIVVASPRGRAKQLITGANTATGSLLLFLHADTALPHGYRAHVLEALRRPQPRQPGGSCWGAFERMAIDGSAPGLRWVEWGVALRTRCFHTPYGDQAIYVTTEALRRVGGVKDMPFMEDYELVSRLRRLARPGLVKAVPVTTSRRRWESVGTWKTTLVNQAMLVGYHVGVPLDWLQRVYSGVDRRGGQTYEQDRGGGEGGWGPAGKAD